jgi:ABC-type uncharacterized transport system substrate-binding protein
MVHARRLVLLAWAPLACLVVANSTRAAYEVSTITGVVADSAGAPLGGTRVTLSGKGITPLHATADPHGHYRFPAIPPHHMCSVTAESSGYRSVAYEGMLTEPGRTRTVNFRLKRPGDRDIVVLVTRDPFPYEEFVRGLEARAAAPVRVVDLDREANPAEAVRRVRAEHPDIIVGAGLRAARLIRRDVVDIPSILTLITDPRRYDLQSETTGFLMGQPEADRVLDRIASILPHSHRLGLVYQAEVSSLLARDLVDAARHRALATEFRLCRTIGDLQPALDDLRGRIDVLIVPEDDLTSTRRAQEIITSWSLKNHVPLAAPTPAWVERGALFSYGASYERLGEETAVVAGQVLGGVLQPSDFKVIRSQEYDLAVNQSSAARLGVDIPSGLKVDTLY